MRTALTLTAIILGLAFATPGWGCLAPTRPLPDSEYPTILLAEVVGVHLTEYAENRVRELRDGLEYWSDSSDGYAVDIVPFEVLKGASDEKMSLRVRGGCGVPTPDLQQFAIFYVDKEGAAHVILQSDEEYRDRLTKLGSHYATSCDTSRERFAPHPCWKPDRALLSCLRLVDGLQYELRSSCPAGTQEASEYLKARIVGPYDWKPPLMPTR